MKHHQRNKTCGLGQGMFFIAILFSFLFGACAEPLSLADFIKENTSTAKVVNYDIHLNSRKIANTNRTGFKETYDLSGRRTLVFFIAPGLDTIGNKLPKNIELELSIYNPQGYNLLLEPDYRVYNLEDDKYPVYPYNGVNEAKDDKNPRRSVEAIQTSASTALLKISHAVIGERYDIKLNISMADGSRVFDAYTNIPSIVFNTPLRGPRTLELHAKKDPNLGWYPYAHWRIEQLEKDHPGISRITLLFQEERASADWILARFIYEKIGDGDDNKVWKFLSADSNIGTIARELDILNRGSNENFDQFEVRFPMEMDTEYIQDIITALGSGGGRLVNTISALLSPYKSYNFVVTVQDQSGLTAQAGFDDGMTADETTILKSLRVRDNRTGRQINEGFYFPGFVNYSMEVPFDTESILIEYEKSSDYPEQEISKGGSIISGPMLFPITAGSALECTFTVRYENDEVDYQLNITRLRPDRDSKLADIKVDAPSITPIIRPAFNSQISGTYMVNVQSSDDKVQLNALLPEMDENDPAYAFFYHPVTNPRPKVPSIVSLFNGSQELFTENPKNYTLDPAGTFKMVDGKWTLSLKPGPNPFTIKVQPEAGPVTTYSVTIDRAPATNDTSADLKDLKITAPSNPDIAVPLAPNFDGRIASYEVNVSNAYSSVVIAAEVLDNTATVTSIIDFRESNTLPITKTGATYSANLTGLEQGGSYPVTIRVASPKNSRDYNVLVNRMLPDVGGITLVEWDGSVALSWAPVSSGSGVSGTSTYEVYYHTDHISNPDNIIGTAKKWSPVAGSTSTTVTGLVNNMTYHFWLRAMRGTVPGEWNSQLITAVPKSGNDALVGIAVSGGTPIAPLNFAPETLNYTNSPIIVPFAGTESITITGTRGESHQSLAYNPSDGTIALNPGESKDVQITVTSHDGRNTKQYTFRVHRMLPGPQWSPSYPLEAPGAVALQWERPPAPSNGTISYDVYYHTVSTAPPSPPNNTPGAGTYLSTSATSLPAITGLNNGQQYYFWVRGVIGGIPGEWSAVGTAMPKSNIASLSGIAVNGTSILINNVNDYSVTVDSDVSSVTVIIDKGDKDQWINYNLLGGGSGAKTTPSPSLTQDEYIITLNAGTSSLLNIALFSQNNGNSHNYTVMVNRRPVAPGLTVVAKNPSVNLSWGSSAGATAYELYYSRTDAPVSLTVGQTGAPAGTTAFSPYISGTGASIPNLNSQQRYYFYLRAKATGNLVGGTIYSEWETISVIPYSDLAVLKEMSPASGTISPPLNTASDDKYYLTGVSSDVTWPGDITITADHGGTWTSELTSNPEQLSITVTSLDGSATKTYTIYPQ